MCRTSGVHKLPQLNNRGPRVGISEVTLRSLRILPSVRIK
jgi:hypothetical protein